MRIPFISIVASCLLLGAVEAKASTVQDENTIQGTWTIVSVEEQGKKQDLPKNAKKFAITADKIITGDGETLGELTYKLDASKNPKWIDLTVQGEKQPGIFEIVGDDLKICSNKERGGNRPTRFEAKANSQHYLLVFKRAKHSPASQVLERYIGTWDSVVTDKTNGKNSNTIERRKWSRKGQFILSEDFDSSTNKEAHFLLTYDPNSKVYRACFINAGAVSNYVGTWDGANDAMTWNGTDSFGNKQVGTYRFIDKDHVEWSMVFTNPDGKVVLELSTKQTRRKEQ